VRIDGVPLRGDSQANHGEIEVSDNYSVGYRLERLERAFARFLEDGGGDGRDNDWTEDEPPIVHVLALRIVLCDLGKIIHNLAPERLRAMRSLYRERLLRIEADGSRGRFELETAVLCAELLETIDPHRPGSPRHP
jgi:hypothetical protein